MQNNNNSINSKPHRKDSELVLAPNGTLYHIHLDYNSLADNVILVGDPGRLDLFKPFFNTIEHESFNREIRAITGTVQDSRITVLSTGMGCDNIDIIMTELDAAANIDLETGLRRQMHRTLNIVRIGSCGGLQPDLPAGTLVASKYAIGMDGLLHYYKHEKSDLEDNMTYAFEQYIHFPEAMSRPYAATADTMLLNVIAPDIVHGITVTAPGFYGPQGRDVALRPVLENLTDRLAGFHWDGLRVANLEMETSAIYGLSKLMHHRALTVCLVIANRVAGSFLNDYHKEMSQVIGKVLNRIATLK